MSIPEEQEEQQTDEIIECRRRGPALVTNSNKMNTHSKVYQDTETIISCRLCLNSCQMITAR